MKILVLTTLVVAVLSKYETYEPVVEEVYHQLNAARRDPSGKAGDFKKKAEDLLNGASKAGNLKWSAGLSRAC